MSLFEYDFDDLARQLQHGLERIAVNFLRQHGARMRRDDVDFHGFEQVDLELSHAGHVLKVRQVGRPRGPGLVETPASELGPGEEFESTFDGWPTEDLAREDLASWLAALPLGAAPPEARRAAADASNPFAAERPATRPSPEGQPGFNPFLSEGRSAQGSNPFADPDRERKRQEMLRRLKGDDD
jgi:hypothetical protein